MSESQIVRLGLADRKVKISKYVAGNDEHLRKLIARLDETGDVEAADTIAWLVWWREQQSLQTQYAWERVAEVERRTPETISS